MDNAEETLFNFTLEHRRPNVLIVDDDPIMALLLEALLQRHVNTRNLYQADEVFSLWQDYAPDLVIMDISMPGLDGLSCCRLLKENRHTAEVPVIFITGDDSEEQENDCWKAGASDFIRKPFNHLTLWHRVHNQLTIKLQRDQLSRQAFEDPLTRLYNRRYLNKHLIKEVKTAQRHHRNLSLIMMDIDYFKQYNDNYGHLAGDQCIEHIAHTIELNLKRPGDWVARYGGEEFIGVLPETSADNAQQLAEQIRRYVESLNLEHLQSPYRKVTLSMGIAAATDSQSPEEILATADRALYQAKRQGRNKIQLAEAPPQATKIKR